MAADQGMDGEARAEQSGEHKPPDETCPECGGQGTYYGCKACDDTGRRRCSGYTARRWSPGADQPEDDRCANCGQAEAAHIGRSTDG